MDATFLHALAFSSALLKRCIDEHDSDETVELMANDAALLTSRITSADDSRQSPKVRG